MRPAVSRLAALLLVAAASSAPAYPVPAVSSGTAGGAQAPAATATGSPRVQPLPRTGISAVNSLRAPAARPDAPAPAHRPTEFLRWLWRYFWPIGAGATSLARATVAAIALLAAFLTVVQTWQIPPPSTPLASPQSAPETAGKASAPAATAPQKNGAATDKSPSPFDSNFARTVFSGLGGMFAVTFLDSLWASAGFNAKAYYLVLFVIFFLAILFFFAFLRACGEALRSRVAVPFSLPVRQYLSRPKPPVGTAKSPASTGRLQIGTAKPQNGKLPAGSGDVLTQEPWYCYRPNCFWHWLLSWRSSLLVFWDTAFNVIQGKNQLQTVVFQNSIIELQRSLWLATRQVCQEIHLAVIEALRKHEPGIEYGSIRVNVSMLSDDEQSLFYVAWEIGSLPAPFGKVSVAWIAVVSGEAKWYKHKHRAEYETAHLTKDPTMLGRLGVTEALGQSFYQVRGRADYEGFIVLPIPWGSRGEASHYRRAGLHISFRDSKLMDQLWNHLEREPTAQELADGRLAVPNYCQWTGLLKSGHSAGGLLQRLFEGEPAKPQLEAKEATVRAVLQQSVHVLAELLRHFNQQVFEDYIKPHIVM